MDFIELKNAAARDIALAFGVPPLVLGIAGDNTHANFAEANKVFWRQCVAPLVKKTVQSLGAWFGQHAGHGVVLTPDFDAVDAMTETREPLWRAITAADFLSESEKRIALGYPAKKPKAEKA